MSKVTLSYYFDVIKFSVNEMSLTLDSTLHTLFFALM